MSEETKNLKIDEFDITPLVHSTYNKIAVWHNEEGSQVELKHLAIELIEEIAGAAFKHLGIPYTTGFEMTEEQRALFNAEKIAKDEPDSSLGELSDEQLLKEIAKRRNKAAGN